MNNLLYALHEYIRPKIRQECIDPKTLTWTHINEVSSINFWESTKKRQKEVLLEAQKFLSPFAKESACQQMKEKWRNTGYCPDAPYGAYIWTFQCSMVQELLWLYPEFVAGFEYGSTPGRHQRDANPYKERGRYISWDRGYILGLSAPKVEAWLQENTKEGV